MLAGPPRPHRSRRGLVWAVAQQEAKAAAHRGPDTGPGGAAPAAGTQPPSTARLCPVPQDPTPPWHSCGEGTPVPAGQCGGGAALWVTGPCMGSRRHPVATCPVLWLPQGLRFPGFQLEWGAGGGVSSAPWARRPAWGLADQRLSSLAWPSLGAGLGRHLPPLPPAPLQGVTCPPLLPRALWASVSTCLPAPAPAPGPSPP